MDLATFDQEKVLAIIAAILAAIPVVITIAQFLKKRAEGIESDHPDEWYGKLAGKIAHNWGPWLITLVVALSVKLPELATIADDGKLMLNELPVLLEILGITVGSPWIYKLIRLFAFTKK